MSCPRPEQSAVCAGTPDAQSSSSAYSEKEQLYQPKAAVDKTRTAYSALTVEFLAEFEKRPAHGSGCHAG